MTEQADKPKEWIRVPAGTTFTSCKDRQCQKRMYFVKHPRTGKAHPIDCDVPGGVHPSRHRGEALPSLFSQSRDAEPLEASDGLGISHFETCVGAEKFRRGGIGD